MPMLAAFGGFFYTAVTLASLGVAMWWLIRRRRREMRFPIARILNIPQTRLPRIVLRMPPLVPFILFTLSAIAFVLWTAQPRIKEFSSHEPRQLRVHVFVDMSPSVSANVNLLELARKVGGLWGDLHNASRATLSTSHSDTIYDVRDAAQVEDIIQGLGFHRAGTLIGSSVKQHLLQTGEIDRLIIVTDRDQHSWSGFQWRFLVDETEVFWLNVDTTQASVAKTNAFINAARIVSAPGALSVDWDVDIAQGGVPRSQEGTLRVLWRGETLASTTWKLNETSRQATIHVAWPSTKTPQQVSEDPLIWEITPQGEDALLLDNEFRSTMNGRGGFAHIIAEPSGETSIEDPGAGLLTVFRVMGLVAERVDVAPVNEELQKKAKSPDDVGVIADFTVMLGGLGRGVDVFCPKNLQNAAWVVPWGEDVDFQELCECVRRIRGDKLPGCENVHVQSDWVSWLQSSGGKQVGGEVGQSQGAVAYAFQSGTESTDVLALTIPLKPSQKYGLSHGRFPLLVRQLFAWRTWGDVDAMPTQSADWLRETDVSRGVQGVGEKVFSGQKKLALSNVPLAESLLAVESTTELPSPWDSTEAEAQRKGSGKLDSENPLPWIRFVVAVILGAALIELLWNVVRRRRRRRLAPVLGLVVGVIFGLTVSSSAVAQIQIDFFGVPSSQGMTFSRLAREVSSRTSIELQTKAVNHDVLNQSLMEQPWMWIRSPDHLVDKKGGMTPPLARWVKRGGVILVESAAQDDALWDRFVAPLQKGSFRALGWNPVPQDHELMRSFYLLETLPTCGGKVWRWYGIDGRLAMLQVPYNFSSNLQDQPQKPPCETLGSSEYQVRVFVNILMVALTTDYKRDQIHLPEILKRLRSP